MNAIGPYLINERVVTFDGKAFPQSGHIVVLAGGPGTGKSFLKETLILINGKVFDPDQISKTFNAMGLLDSSKFKDGEFLDWFYTEKVKPLNDKKVQTFFQLISSKHKSNIIFDSSGRSIDKIKPILETMKTLGYKLTLVRVIADMKVAWQRNLARERTVPKDTFDEIHKGTVGVVNKYKNLFDYIWSIDNTLNDKRWWIKHPELIRRIK